jgi:hypothetical protein
MTNRGWTQIYADKTKIGIAGKLLIYANDDSGTEWTEVDWVDWVDGVDGVDRVVVGRLAAIPYLRKSVFIRGWGFTVNSWGGWRRQWRRPCGRLSGCRA